ncbi:MAG: flagellar hook assembly protein FlgD [Gammaproteobacteria bacterium]|nr:flagellar hook assembly protein FlgD [Gammaproteobacteria bacterium]
MTNPVNGLPPELSHLELKQPEKKANKELGQNEFLDLMIAQLKHQDPLNPLESDQFLGQLAQFGTVNGITELQTSFGDLAASLQSSQALQASTLVGRNVLISGNVVRLSGDQPVDAAVELDASVDNLSVQILDPAGQLVRNMNFEQQASGVFNFQWDGRDSSGNAVPPGNYVIRAVGRTGEEEIAHSTLIQAKVDSVTLARGGQGPLLNLDNIGVVSLSEVIEVR